MSLFEQALVLTSVVVRIVVLGLLLDEVKCLLVLALLRQDPQVQFDELLINHKARLLHQFQQEQVRDVENLRLEPESQADQVHRLDRPLRIYVLRVDLVQVKSLILLLEELALPHVGEEHLLAEVLAVRVLIEHTLEQGCHLGILAERHIAVDKVKDCSGITLLLADLSNYLLTLVVLAHFQETVGLNCVEKCLLRVLLEAFNNNN